MKKGEITVIAFADFSKAFYTVDYATVLKKLHSIGFTRNALYWVLSYLKDRQQFVQINDQQLQPVKVQFGVLQGSILGPVLFNLYVNDLETDCDSMCLQYANDTTLYQHSVPKALEECTEKLNRIMSSLEK